MAVVEQILSWLRQLVGLILPIFSKARDLPGLGSGLRWTVRILLIAGTLVGLWFLNKLFDIRKIVPKAPDFSRDFWLPILGLLIIILCWLGWWLWKLLGPDEQVSDFPDIDEAWEQAMKALLEAGTDVTEVPLFLVLGRPAETEEGLFAAADLRATIRGAPPRANAPLHVYGYRDGRYDSVFVTCAGASLLGRQAAFLNGDISSSSVGEDGAEQGGMTEDELVKTLKPEGDAKEVVGIIQQALKEGRGIDQLTAEERRQLRVLDRKTKPPLLKNAAEAERSLERLKHLCRLIVRDRRPYCGINGLVVLLPFAATDSDEDAQQTGAICQYDLAAAREVLQLHCPTLALLCDLETTSGFREFMERFPKEKLKQRLGQRFPLVPDLEKNAIAPKIESGAGWICQSLFPTWIYKFFRVESPDKEKREDAIRGNSQLVKFLCQLRERQKRLGQILTRSFASTDQDGPLMFGGCYVSATGKDPARDQAFLAGFFRKVIENQNFVAWTDQALEDDKAYYRWTKYGYGAIGILTVALIGLGYILWPFGK